MIYLQMRHQDLSLQKLISQTEFQMSWQKGNWYNLN